MCPKLSIVIPVYNRAKYVKTCLEMIQRQTLQDWEAGFVDDGSTDDSGELLDELAKTDERGG